MSYNNWQQWKYHYRDQIAHVAGFEERFVDTVLSEISYIQPDDVIPQYHFIDKKGRNRKIDFMIKNEEKGFLLAIELDGLWKTQNYEVFNDMLERQNSLIDSFGIVLRYTNKKMIYESQEIIDEIYDVLNKQANKKSTDQIRDAHAQKLLQNYEQEIEKLKQQNAENREYQIRRDEYNQKLLQKYESKIERLKQQNAEKRAQQMKAAFDTLRSQFSTLQEKVNYQKNEVSKIVKNTLAAVEKKSEEVNPIVEKEDLSTVRKSKDVSNLAVKKTFDTLRSQFSTLQEKVNDQKNEVSKVVKNTLSVEKKSEEVNPIVEKEDLSTVRKSKDVSNLAVKKTSLAEKKSSEEIHTSSESTQSNFLLGMIIGFFKAILKLIIPSKK